MELTRIKRPEGYTGKDYLLYPDMVMHHDEIMSIIPNIKARLYLVKKCAELGGSLSFFLDLLRVGKGMYIAKKGEDKVICPDGSVVDCSDMEVSHAWSSIENLAARGLWAAGNEKAGGRSL